MMPRNSGIVAGIEEQHGGALVLVVVAEVDALTAPELVGPRCMNTANG